MWSDDYLDELGIGETGGEQKCDDNKTLTKIYIGNLPENCHRSDLQEIFEKYGEVEECDVVKNYGFVHMRSQEEARRAIEELNNSEFLGTTITVEMSHSKVRPRPGMGGKGQCFRCGRQGHWSKECPRGPSRAMMPGGSNGYRSHDPYGSLPPPQSYVYRNDRMGSRYGGERIRPYPEPYDRRPMSSSLPPPRPSAYDRRSPPAMPDYMYPRAPSPVLPPDMTRHSVYDAYRFDNDPYEMAAPPSRPRYAEPVNWYQNSYQEYEAPPSPNLHRSMY